MDFTLNDTTLLVLAWAYFSFVVGFAARSAGKSFYMYSFTSLYFSPAVTYVFLLVKVLLEKNYSQPHEPVDNIKSWEVKHCPHCSKAIRIGARQCWECHKPIPDEVPA